MDEIGELDFVYDLSSDAEKVDEAGQDVCCRLQYTINSHGNDYNQSPSCQK
jgi:hypothetical protein